MLSKLDYSPRQLLPFVDMYNPDTHFVALATVRISRPGAGKNNAIMLCEMIGRDMQLVTKPNFGDDGQVLHCQTVTGEVQIAESSKGSVSTYSQQ